MNFFLSLILGLAQALDGELTYKGTPRSPNPLAPSLPQLTEAEYTEIDGVIDRFIQFDIGNLKGGEGRKALDALMRLGPEAVFPLIEGFNRAAKLQDSCPAVIIAAKLSRILDATHDLELLEYARENIGAGGAAARHLRVVKDLRLGCNLRKSYLLRLQATETLYPGQKPLASMSLPELATAAEKERGKNLQKVIRETDRRRGADAFDILALAAAKPDKDAQPFARSALTRQLGRQSAAKLKEKLQDERAEVRAAAVSVVASRKLPWGFELIGMLEDSEPRVGQAARKALVQLARGSDFGPEPTASPGVRSAAVSRWREWWSMRKTR